MKKDKRDSRDKRIRELENTLRIAGQALHWAHTMLLARDLMNAAVHCAPVRLSPITERCDKARLLLCKELTKWKHTPKE